MNAFLSSIGYNSWVLPALLLIPLLGAAAIWIRGAMVDLPAGADEFASGAGAAPRWIALIAFAAEFIVSVGLWWSFDPANAAWQSTVDLPWIPSWGIRFTIGVDGIAVMMVLLTTFIMLLSVGGSWTSIRKRTHSYYALLLVLTTGMLGVFRRARSLPVLRDVGSDAHPDVLHRRDLGRRATPLREPQVLHLHDGRIAAHARGDHLPRPPGARSGDRDCRTSITISCCTAR